MRFSSNLAVDNIIVFWPVGSLSLPGLRIAMMHIHTFHAFGENKVF